MFYASELFKKTPQKQTASAEDNGKDLFDTEIRLDLDGAATPASAHSATNLADEQNFRQSVGGFSVTVRKIHHDSLTMHALSSSTRTFKLPKAHTEPVLSQRPIRY